MTEPDEHSTQRHTPEPGVGPTPGEPEDAFPWDALEEAFFRAQNLERAATRLEAALARYVGYTEAARAAMLEDLGPDARGLEPWESLDVLRHVLRGGYCDEVGVRGAGRLPGQVPDGGG